MWFLSMVSLNSADSSNVILVSKRHLIGGLNTVSNSVSPWLSFSELLYSSIPPRTSCLSSEYARVLLPWFDWVITFENLSSALANKS